MKLVNALKKGKWVRRKSWPEGDEFWLRRVGDVLVDDLGYSYPLDFSDFEDTEWEVRKKK